MDFDKGRGAATLTPPRIEKHVPPVSHGRGHRVVALAGVLIYGFGMLGGMLWSAFSSGDLWVGLLFLPQALLALTFGAGSMGMALLAPDPYIAEDGQAPATLPDFD